MQNTKHPCGICQKRVRKNQTACFCSLCKHWVHFTKCNHSSLAEYHLLVEEDESVPWYCLQCTIKQISEIFPFGLSTKEELLDLYQVDRPSFLFNLPSYEMRSKLGNIPNLSDVDAENNLVSAINSDYYEQDSFKHSFSNLKKPSVSSS